MKPWQLIDRARSSDGTELTLMRHVSEYIIQADGQTLMSSRIHGSEDTLATLGCLDAGRLSAPRVLVGGLGMGFTLRAALDCLPPGARVTVAEIHPVVAEWNCGPLGPLAGHPLDDPRVALQIGDVIDAMRSRRGAYDAILLDVDNGPAALASRANVSLYNDKGVSIAKRSLKSGGVLAVWSAKEDATFEHRLRSAGFHVRQTRVSSRDTKRGSRHTILVARTLEASTEVND